MLESLKSIRVNYIQGAITVSGKEHQVTINNNQVSCNANTGTPENPSWINISIDRNTGKQNVTISNYADIQQGAADAQLIIEALTAVVDEVQNI